MIGWYDSRVRGAINHWQFFLRTCSPKMHPVANAKISRELLKVFDISIVIELPSDNYDLRLLLHHRCCPQVEIGSLEWVEPAYKEEYRLMERETKYFSCFLLVVCNKKLKIYSRRPVMAVQHVILSSFIAPECFNIVDKFWQVLVQIVLVQRGKGPGLDVDDSHILAQLNDAGGIFVCPTGKDINVCLVMT